MLQAVHEFDIQPRVAERSQLICSLIWGFPDLIPFLACFEEFDFEKAMSEGLLSLCIMYSLNLLLERIIPIDGVIKEYDDVSQQLVTIKEDLDRYLGEQKRQSGIRELEYHFSKTEQYTIKCKKKFLKGKTIPQHWKCCANLKVSNPRFLPFLIDPKARISIYYK